LRTKGKAKGEDDAVIRPTIGREREKKPFGPDPKEKEIDLVLLLLRGRGSLGS